MLYLAFFTGCFTGMFATYLFLRPVLLETAQLLSIVKTQVALKTLQDLKNKKEASSEYN